MLPLNITVSCEPVCPGGEGDRAWQRRGGRSRIEEVGDNSFFPILRCKLLLNTSEFSIATEKVHKPFSSNLVIFITFLSASPNHCWRLPVSVWWHYGKTEGRKLWNGDWRLELDPGA